MASLASRVELLVKRISSRASSPDCQHITAFSGGVDSSLALKLVSLAYPSSSIAVIGVSAALPESQLELARTVAASIGAPLTEVKTDEGANPDYIENKGASCFHCKTALYSTLQSVLNHTSTYSNVTLYNGTNMDDTSDPTRVGLLAAANFSVQSPLDTMHKSEVRELAKHLGLPNYAHAASPCLRSRLAFGVEATAEHLRRIEDAENFVKTTLGLNPEDNFRVRQLSGGRAMLELEPTSPGEDDFSAQRSLLHQSDIDKKFTGELGFSSWNVRAFKSGGEAVKVTLTNA